MQQTSSETLSTRLPAAHVWPLTAHVAQNRLEVGGCDLATLAAMYGTPLYLLDAATIRTQTARYTAAFRNAYGVNVAIHYASKALLNTGVAQLMLRLGLGLDVVSAGELQIALRAGADPRRVHLHGNGTPPAELALAVEVGIGTIVVDNLAQLDVLASITAHREQPQPILLRVAPDVADYSAHSHIQTGSAQAKFGLNIEDGSASEAVRRALKASGLQVLGLHAHIGSQIRDWEALRRAIGRLLAFAAHQRAERGWTLNVLSPGGGLAVAYLPEETTPDVETYATTVAGVVRAGCERAGLPLPKLVIEPGRSLIARSGVALYTITGSKTVAGGHSFLHIDGGMGDNPRPALYSAKYTALPAIDPLAEAVETVQIAGRYCESGDILIPEVALPSLAVGDVLAVPVAGAYTLSMSSTYNGVPRPPLLLVDEGCVHVLQRRETIDDLLIRDQPLPT